MTEKQRLPPALRLLHAQRLEQARKKAEASNNGKTARLGSVMATMTSTPTLTHPLPTMVEPDPVHLTDKVRSAEEVPRLFRLALRDCRKGICPWPLTLAGKVGVGKTYAALCFTDHCPSSSEFWTLEELCNLLTASMNELWYQRFHTKFLRRREEKIGNLVFWDYVGGLPLLVIDEIGSRLKVSDHRYETLKGVLDRREDRPLIMTSNLTIKQTRELYDDRIASRIAAGTFVWCDDDDRRLHPRAAAGREE